LYHQKTYILIVFRYIIEANDYETYNQPSIIVPANSIKIKSAIAPIPNITRVNKNPNKEQASIFASKPKPGKIVSFYFS